MPIEEIKPGMVGTGRTIFEGTEMKDFKVHILGVLKNVQAPQRNLILARLEGGPLAETGVIAGMSGSPVYIDGRLIGAVSYSIGAFPKEPIAGITPIAEMIEATAERRRAPRRLAAGADRAAGHAGAPRRRHPRELRAHRARSPIVPPTCRRSACPASAGSQMGALLRPIATPLMMSGMDSRHVRSRVVDVPRRGVHADVLRRRRRRRRRRKPGRCVPAIRSASSLLGGDAEMGATGTVTHIDGDRASTRSAIPSSTSARPRSR